MHALHAYSGLRIVLEARVRTLSTIIRPFPEESGINRVIGVRLSTCGVAPEGDANPKWPNMTSLGGHANF